MMEQEQNNLILEVMLKLTETTERVVNELLESKDWLKPYLQVESFTHLDIVKDGRKVLIYNKNRNKAKEVFTFSSYIFDEQLLEMESYEESLTMFLETVLCSIAKFVEGINEAKIEVKSFYNKHTPEFELEYESFPLYDYNPELAISFGNNNMCYITHKHLNTACTDFLDEKMYLSKKVIFNNKFIELPEEEQEIYLESNIKSFKVAYENAFNFYLKTLLLAEKPNIRKKLHQFCTIMSPTSNIGRHNVQMAYKEHFESTNILTFVVNPLIEYRLNFDDEYFDKFVLRYITMYKKFLEINNNRPFVLGVFNSFRISFDDDVTEIDYVHRILPNNLTENDYFKIYYTICDSFTTCYDLGRKTKFEDLVSNNKNVTVTKEKLLYVDADENEKIIYRVTITNLFKPEIINNRVFRDTTYFTEDKEFINQYHFYKSIKYYTLYSTEQI